MSNVQLLLSVSIPTLAVIVSMIINNGRFNAIESRLISIEGDVRRFYQELGHVQGRVDSMERRGH